MGESRVEALERESLQFIGSVVCPSALEAAREISAYVKVPNASQYRVFFASGECQLVSQSALKRLLVEDVSEEAVI